MRCTRYLAGAAVPENIIALQGSGGDRPVVTFSGDTDVFETDERFVLITVGGDNVGTVTITGGAGDWTVYAPTKQVDVVRGWDRLEPQGRLQ